MTNKSHTKLAARALKWKSRIQDRWFMLSYDTTMELGDLLEQLAAALESPERVQGDAQYPLPDELYESKDWKAAGYAGRVEWLHAMYEAKKKELGSFLSMATQATAPAQDAQGEAYKLSDEDINEGAERHGITVAGPRLEDFYAGVRWTELVLANPPDADTPSPQAKKQPLSDKQIEKLRDATFSINNPFCPVDSKSMRKAVRAAERAHGIVTKESA